MNKYYAHQTYLTAPDVLPTSFSDHASKVPASATTARTPKPSPSSPSKSSPAVPLPSGQSRSSSFSSRRPLLSESLVSSRKTSSRAWHKTKKFLSNIGEPPTAQYEREQAAAAAALRQQSGPAEEEEKKGVKGPHSSGPEAFRGTNYGPYYNGGFYGQSRI